MALHKSTLPGGVKIEKGKLRGVVSNGMLCGLTELGLDERDFPYAAITPAALLNDYKPLDPDKPSIPADIQPGHKIYGPAWWPPGCWSARPSPTASFHTCLDIGGATAVRRTPAAPNLHEGDLVAYNTKADAICTLDDLHAQQAEFPHCIPDGIFVLQEDCAARRRHQAASSTPTTTWWSSRSPPTGPDCLSVIGLAREAGRHLRQPLCASTSRWSRAAAAAYCPSCWTWRPPPPTWCPRYTARMVRNVKIAPSPKWMRERLRSMRRAAHQQHRGHHQLCDAGIRPAHARLRLPLRKGRQDRRPPAPRRARS